jgi:siroheme synthase (precorrin-2 oxidase/ferrochelatase)
MSQVNYGVMSDDELKQYFLQNRRDEAALEAYLDRLNQKPRTIIASPGDPDFNEKIEAAIRQKLQQPRNQGSFQREG